MKNKKRRIWIGILVVLLLLLIGPFLVPVPPLENTRPPQELADPDSQFIDIGDLSVHYKTLGQGEPVFILLHGFGASTFTWREVMAPLAAYGKIIAYDRPAFGLTERPLDWQGENPYGPEGQVSLLFGLMDALEIERAILVGNSAGGTVALQAALQDPQRVQGLILVDPAIYTTGGAHQLAQPLLRTPQMRRLGPLLVRRIETLGMNLIRVSWHDPSLLTTDVLEGYRKPLGAENWDKALWEMVLAYGSRDLPGRLDELAVPTLVITGDDDRIVPTAQSIRLAEELPGARLEVLEACGHVPHEECPEAFLQAVKPFIEEMTRQ